MDKATETKLLANTQSMEGGKSNSALYPNVPADLDALPTPMLIGLPPKEIGPIARRLIFEKRRRNAALETAREMFEQAYACAMLDLESALSQPFETDDQIARCIDFIEAVRKFRVDALQSTVADEFPLAYSRPTTEQVRQWRMRHSHSQIIADHRLSSAAIEDISNRDALLYAIAQNFLWRRCHRAYVTGFAECVRSMDPDIDCFSSEAQIWRAINRVNLERRFGAKFTPSQLRAWL